MAKRARELAVKEKRDRKRAKKAEAAAQRDAANNAVQGEGVATAEVGAEPAAGDDVEQPL